MLWLETFYCENCGLEFEDLVDRGSGEATCPDCEQSAKRLSPTQTSPTYGKHGSWADWRKDMDWNKPGK